MNGKTCSKCGEADAGPGNILCGPCRAAIEAAPLYPLLPDVEQEVPTDDR